MNNDFEINLIVKKSREEINYENNLNNDFVDCCDLVSERILSKLHFLGYEDAELINGYYRHAFDDSEEDYYGHIWIELNNIIIDGTRDQFDNFNFIIKKENSKNYFLSLEEVKLQKERYFHFTNKDFENFESTKKGTVSTILGAEKVYREGIYFSKNRNFSKSFGNVEYEVELDIKKTLDLKNGFKEELISEFKDSFCENWMEKILPINVWEIFDGEDAKYTKDTILKKGYDSVVINEDFNGDIVETMIVFEPELIKIINKKRENLKNKNLKKKKF